MADDPNTNLIYYVDLLDVYNVGQALRDGANPNLIYLSQIIIPSRIQEESSILYDDTENYMENNRLEIVRLFLDAGADINRQDEKGNTPLMYAAIHGDHKMIALLMERGADERIQNKNGNNALHLCKYNKDPDSCRRIIINKQKNQFKQQVRNSLPMLASQFSRYTPQTKEDWLQIFLRQKHEMFCSDKDIYRYLGALWGMAELLDVEYSDLMLNDKYELCERLRKKLSHM